MKLSVVCPFGVFGRFHPQNGEQCQRNPPKGICLRESASFEPLSVKIGRRVWPVESSWNKKGIKIVIFYALSRSPHRRIFTKFDTAVEAADIITCTKFFGDRSRGVDSVGVEICHLPLTMPVAVNTGLALPRSPWYVCQILLLVFCTPKNINVGWSDFWPRFSQKYR